LFKRKMVVQVWTGLLSRRLLRLRLEVQLGPVALTYPSILRVHGFVRPLSNHGTTACVVLIRLRR
jgi:hypothetical protein